MNWSDDFPEICRERVPLAPYTWFRLGGPAEYFVEPRTIEQLGVVLRRCRENEIPVRLLGLGANVLVPDEGVSGVVVRLAEGPFVESRFEGDELIAGAGADLTKLVRTAVRRGLAGLEHIAGIPGTVGGGVAMNCGGRYGEIGSAVVGVQVIGSDGALYERDHDDLAFAYRGCALGADCVVQARFHLHKTDPEELDRRFREIWMYKQSTQPPLGVQSVGCIFKNPEGRSAGMLIDQAGLKGQRIGSASVSERHANFVVCEGGGRAADVLALIQLIQDRVEAHSGVRLEPEVKIWQSSPLPRRVRRHAEHA